MYWCFHYKLVEKKKWLTTLRDIRILAHECVLFTLYKQLYDIEANEKYMKISSVNNNQRFKNYNGDEPDNIRWVIISSMA